jgi:hypothetical protein
MVLVSVLIAACTQPSGGGAGASAGAPAPVETGAPAPVETTDGYSY